MRWRLGDNGSHALTSTHPRHRYRMGLDSQVVFPLLGKLPSFVTDPLYLFMATSALPLPVALQPSPPAEAL
jgi:hypothetical protein